MIPAVIIIGIIIIWFQTLRGIEDKVMNDKEFLLSRNQMPKKKRKKISK